MQKWITDRQYLCIEDLKNAEEYTAKNLSRIEKKLFFLGLTQSDIRQKKLEIKK